MPLKKGSDKCNSQLSELISRAISESCKAEVVLQGAGSNNMVYKGDITEWNLFRMYPFEDSICLLELTREQQHLSARPHQRTIERDNRGAAPKANRSEIPFTIWNRNNRRQEKEHQADPA